MSPRLKAIVITLALAGVFVFGWRFLAQKLQPNREVSPYEILDQLEKQGAPDFTLPRLAGGSYQFSETKGKIVFLNFWASWCEPCLKEFPSLLKLVEHFKGEIVLVAVSADEDDKDVETFLTSFKAVGKPNVVILRDPQRQVIEKLFNTKQLPESYIFNRDGKLLRKIIGIEDWYTPNAIEFFQDLVSAK